jgi:hypothetical protein
MEIVVHRVRSDMVSELYKRMRRFRHESVDTAAPQSLLQFTVAAIDYHKRLERN